MRTRTPHVGPGCARRSQRHQRGRHSGTQATLNAVGLWQVFAVPKKKGNFTAWLVVTAKEAKGVGGNAEDVGLDHKAYDSVVLKRWRFEVTEPRRLGLIPGVWDPAAPAPNVR